MVAFLAFLATTAGGLIVDVLSIAILIVPLSYLPLPVWVDVIICASCLFNSLAVISGLACWAVWIWSFIVFIQTPFDTRSILYLCSLGVYLLFFAMNLLLPILLGKSKEKNEDNEF